MNWPSFGGIAMLAAFIATVGFAVHVERKIARGEIPLVPYSFKAVWRFCGIMIVCFTILSLLIYWRTEDLPFALTWFAIFMALTVVGVLRRLLAEYQNKRRGGKNIDA